MTRLVQILTGIAALSALMAGCNPQETKVTGSGIVEATEITLSAAIAGEIDRIEATEGLTVKEGDILVGIDTESLNLERSSAAAGLAEIDAGELQAQAQIAQAKTALEGAHKTYQRAVELKSKGAISIQQFDDANTAYSLAQRQLETAKSALESFGARRESLKAKLAVLDYQISQGIITAPVTGTILQKYTEAGERTAPGKPLLSIAKLDEVWTKIYIDQSDLGRIKLGAEAKVITDTYPERPYPGSVSWISDKAEFTPKNVQTRDARADLVYAVKITLKNPDGVFKIGMPVDVLVQGFPEFDTQTAPEKSKNG